MPHYDESFIHDDNLNQKKNKRSYRVYKQGIGPINLLEPAEVLHALEERGTSVIKRNIRNIKYRSNRVKLDSSQSPTNSKLYQKNGCKSPDIIIDHCLPIAAEERKFYDLRNNNVNLLSSYKSLDNLSSKGNDNCTGGVNIRNGVSLQNLLEDEKLKHFGSPIEDYAIPQQYDSHRNFYSVIEPSRGAIRRRQSRAAQALGSGTYRPINGDSVISNSKTKENDINCEPGSGHRGSLRGANKLARRARSFKDDLLERISNMRSPGQTHHPPHLASAIRSHSPLSPKLRMIGSKPIANEEEEVTPAKELEQLVKQVTYGLKHFSDVITKRKLEMLPDNGTIVFEMIANIHKAIKPYCSRSPQLTNAMKRLCTALACLIRLCDEISTVHNANTENGVDGEVVSAERVREVVAGVTSAVSEAATLAHQQLARPALAPRPALVCPRASTQRNSLPDIPLTPKERCLLTGEAGSEGGVRASHSSESVLDAPDPPPPKPPRPHRKIDLAPPLPPKRKPINDNSLLALSIDRLSLQSHSSGSLDSMLNVSNDDEPRPTNDNHVSYCTPPASDTTIGICSCSVNDGRVSLDSSAQDNTHTNHNRFSNESGFVSVGHSETSTEHSFTSSTFTSHHSSSNTESTYDCTDNVSDLKCSVQSFESRMNYVNSVTAQHSFATKLGSLSVESGDMPPELPAKTRRNIRADVQQHFPNVEIRQSPSCSVHGDVRPHTLADHHPPPLPLKKKHIMAYMEMFGNCSHNAATASTDMFRHSIHTYNLASSQHSNSVGVSVRHQAQRSLAQSFTVQHFGTPPISICEDEAASPVPPEPPALPPKMNKPKQLHVTGSTTKIQNHTSSHELLPPPSPRPASHNSSTDESLHINNNSDDSYHNSSVPGKFPLEDELELMVQASPSPVPSQRSDPGPDIIVELNDSKTTDSECDEDDIILKSDVSALLIMKPLGENNDSPIKGGHPDALIVLATKATKDFSYQEAFLTTYRTWVSPDALLGRLRRRARHCSARSHDLRSTLGLLTRVVADLTTLDLDGPLMQEIMEFIYWLVEIEELPIAKALRQILVEKQKQLQLAALRLDTWGALSLRRDTLLDFKAHEIAEQMTLLDAELFARLTTAEILSWPRDQAEERAPNLTRFTAHFNKMSFWARSRILEQNEARERERFAGKFLKVMKALRKMNNFNSYLALVSALDSPPVQRLGWPRAHLDQLQDHCSLIDSSSSFRAYRNALADTQPPCIPYIGLVLQDLTFVHIGNPDLLPNGSINFTKRWQQYKNIMENMKRFHTEQYKYKKNERIIAMFNAFDDVLSEEAMWQLSETIKPRGQRARPAAAPAAVPSQC